MIYSLICGMLDQYYDHELKIERKHIVKKVKLYVI